MQEYSRAEIFLSRASQLRRLLVVGPYKHMRQAHLGNTSASEEASMASTSSSSSSSSLNQEDPDPAEAATIAEAYANVLELIKRRRSSAANAADNAIVLGSF